MDDIIVYKDESRIDIIDNFLTLRQQKEKNVGTPNIALSDYIAPKNLKLNAHLNNLDSIYSKLKNEGSNAKVLHLNFFAA